MFPVNLTDIQISGVPVRVLTTVDGFYITAVFQHVDINGSPVIVHFDPPIAPDFGTPQLEAAWAKAGGAVGLG